MSIAPPQPPSFLEITEPEIKLRRKRLQQKSRKAGFLLPAADKTVLFPHGLPQLVQYHSS